MTYIPIPTEIKDSVRRVLVSKESTTNVLLRDILDELKLMRMQMEIITGDPSVPDDIEQRE